eukprot:216079-Hanusia_phi.AAC.1
MEGYVTGVTGVTDTTSDLNSVAALGFKFSHPVLPELPAPDLIMKEFHPTVSIFTWRIYAVACHGRTVRTPSESVWHWP